MTLFAIVAQLAFVDIVVALITFRVFHSERQRGVARFAGYRLMQSFQRESGLCVVVEQHRAQQRRPLAGRMTLIACQCNGAVRILGGGHRHQRVTVLRHGAPGRGDDQECRDEDRHEVLHGITPWSHDRMRNERPRVCRPL